MTYRIVVINHKGGVGKTTLAFHLAHLLAEIGNSVLCVDADPQCNLSAMFLGERPLDKLLDEASRRDGQTIWSSLQTSGSAKYLRVGKKVPLWLMPGDVQMYRHEELLAAHWANHRESPTESFEFLTRLGRRLAFAEQKTQAAFTIIDTAPSLGALNRTVALESDFIVTPVGLDLFSARGLKTLGIALVEWMDSWESMTRFVPVDLMTRPGRPILGGYVLQRVPKKSTVGQRLAVQRIQNRVRSDLLHEVGSYDRRIARGSEFDLRLGEIPEMPALQAVQESNEPIWQNNPSTKAVFENVITRLLERMRKMRGRRAP